MSSEQRIRNILKFKKSTYTFYFALHRLWYNAEVLTHFTVPFSIQSSFLIFDVESNMSSARSTVERD